MRRSSHEFTRDVEVTRRLYRSGESEYLIDGEVCRLRDVHELLMDTGLGAKAYAIIEQGKIGMILSSRPADRRQLIEEAAGITKYKSRRRSAELKLEAAQQNLTRIDDIVFEVEKQRGDAEAAGGQGAPLQAAARRAAPLGEGAVRAPLPRAGADHRGGPQRGWREAREREAAAAARVAEVEADLGRLRIEQAEADSRASRIREDAHARELDINRRQQQQEFNRHQAETLAARAAEIAEEIRDLEARREPARIALESRRQAMHEAERARDEAEAVRGGGGRGAGPRAAADRRARRRRRSGAHGGVLGAELGDRAAPRGAARRGAARARRRDARRSSTSSTTTCAAKARRSTPSGPPPPSR